MFFATLSRVFNFFNKVSKSFRCRLLGPSDAALSGSLCTSMNTPATPTAVAALAMTGMCSLLPPDDVPCPPGCWQLCVASITTG